MVFWRKINGGETDNNARKNAQKEPSCYGNIKNVIKKLNYHLLDINSM